MGDPTITFTSLPLGYDYQGGAPAYVRNVSHNIIGPLGNSIYYYWVVAIYPSGTVPPPTPVTVRNAPNILSPMNSILINWVTPNAQVTGYSVLRTTTPIFPGNSNTAVVINTTANTVTDTGSALVAFTLTPVPINRAVVYIDGTGATPVLISTVGIKASSITTSGPITASSITFGDSTTQTTAFTVSQIYNWTQNVQANINQLLGLNLVQFISSDSAFTYNESVPPTGASFAPGGWFIRQSTAGDYRFVINAAGDIWVGPQVTPTGNRLTSHFLITIPPDYATPTNQMLYVYHPTATCKATLESGSTTTQFNLANSTRIYTFSLSSALFQLFDGANVRITINASGFIGLSSGTTATFTPAHTLDLNTDDAGKTTTNTWTITSDIRTKRNVKPLEGGLAIIDQLQPIEAQYNGCACTPDGKTVISFDPDELVKILPRSVTRIRRKLNPDDEDESDVSCVNTHEIMHHLVLAVQQLSRKVK